MKFLLWFGCFVAWVSSSQAISISWDNIFHDKSNMGDNNTLDPWYEPPDDYYPESTLWDFSNRHRFGSNYEERTNNVDIDKENVDIPAAPVLIIDTPKKWSYETPSSPFDTNVWHPWEAPPKPLCEEMHVLIDPDNCQQFYRCIGGQYKQQICPFRTYYKDGGCSMVSPSYCKHINELPVENRLRTSNPTTTESNPIESTTILPPNYPYWWIMTPQNKDTDENEDNGKFGQEAIEAITNPTTTESNSMKITTIIPPNYPYWWMMTSKNKDSNDNEENGTIDPDIGTTTTRNYPIAFDDGVEYILTSTPQSSETTTQDNIDDATVVYPPFDVNTLETSGEVLSESSVEQTTLHDTSDFKTVCYLPLRKEFENFPIDTSLCTHIILAHALLDEGTLNMIISENYETMTYNLVAEMKAHTKTTKPKVLISLGGWNDLEAEKYSRLVNDPDSRRDFIYETIHFLELYGFDGLDLKWQYPKCWLNECNKGPSSDKSGFTALVRELHDAFKPHGLLLSAYVSPVDNIIDIAYDVPAISESLDWLNVMTYNFHGYWDGYTGHVAPLYDDRDYFNADFTIKYWISEGADPKKLLLGIPLYAQTFTLKDDQNNGIRAKTKGPGIVGLTNERKDLLPFHEVCSLIESDDAWIVVRDRYGNRGPYAYKGDQWMSYDDVSEMIRKAKYIKNRGLGGAMVQSITDDDMIGMCGHGSYPLLRALNNELRGNEFYTDSEDCT